MTGTSVIRRADGVGGLVIGVVGDSISAGTPLWDPDPAVLAGIADADERHAWPYWAAQADGRLELCVSAVDGERTDEIATRLDSVVAGAAALVVQGGINDLVQGRSPEYAAAGLRGMVRRGKEHGLPVMVTNVLPWNKGYPDHVPIILELNSLIAEIAAVEGADLLDFYAVLEDPEADGRMVAEWTTDGSHPSVAGHRRLGELGFRLPSSSAAAGA